MGDDMEFGVLDRNDSLPENVRWLPRLVIGATQNPRRGHHLYTGQEVVRISYIVLLQRYRPRNVGLIR